MVQDNLKALIVEDDPVTRMLLAAMVADYGYKALVCSEAETGWSCFEKEKPQLVFLDWLLPGMNGLKLCKKMRASRTGRYAIILMMTCRDKQEDIETAARAGIDYYFPKPVNQLFRAFLAIVHRAVQERCRFEELNRQLEASRQDLEDTTIQLEEAITRANRLTMEAELAFVELNQLFKTAAGGIVLVNRDFQIIRSNETFLRMGGCSQEEAEGRKCHEVFGSCYCHTPECPLVRIQAGEERVQIDLSRETAAGTVHYSVTATPYRTPDGELVGMVEYISDITDRVRIEEALKESERKYKALSSIDELTQLFNKRQFNARLEMETIRTKRYQHPLSLLMLDIDDFKSHNDTYGHPEGDKVLTRLGEILKTSIRTADLACRYGGEEFAVILPHTDSEQALVVAERIRETFAKERFFPTGTGREVSKTISIGLAQYQPDEEPQQLVTRADKHLYLAKRQGKNRVIAGEGRMDAA